MREKEKKRERENLNLGNHITEIPAAQICSQRNQLWQCHCRNRRVKKKIVAIVAMPLLKMGEKKIVAEIWGGIKKKSVTFTIFLQHFHNKSQVISYY